MTKVGYDTDKARMRSQTNPLDQLSVSTSCQADWYTMQGDERVRFCDQCERHVYNLSAMTRGDAEAVIQEHEGRLCTRFYRRADGTIVTQDCNPVWQRPAQRAGQTARAVLSALLGMSPVVCAQTPQPTGLVQLEPATGQAAVLTGTVVDSAGASIGNVIVVLISKATGVQLTTRTSADGTFRFTELVAAPYSVSVESAGFRPETTYLQVAAQSKPHLTMKLQVGEVTMGGPIATVVPVPSPSQRPKRLSLDRGKKQD